MIYKKITLLLCLSYTCFTHSSAPPKNSRQQEQNDAELARQLQDEEEKLEHQNEENQLENGFNQLEMKLSDIKRQLFAKKQHSVAPIRTRPVPPELLGILKEQQIRREQLIATARERLKLDNEQKKEEQSLVSASQLSALQPNQITVIPGGPLVPTNN